MQAVCRQPTGGIELGYALAELFDHSLANRDWRGNLLFTGAQANQATTARGKVHLAQGALPVPFSHKQIAWKKRSQLCSPTPTLQNFGQENTKLQTALKQPRRSQFLTGAHMNDTPWHDRLLALLHRPLPVTTVSVKREWRTTRRHLLGNLHGCIQSAGNRKRGWNDTEPYGIFNTASSLAQRRQKNNPSNRGCGKVKTNVVSFSRPNVTAARDAPAPA
jgi:hypothetical protein